MPSFVVNTSETIHDSKMRGIRMRLVIAFLTTLCPTVCYVARANLSLAIVAMVDRTINTTSTTSSINPPNLLVITNATTLTTQLPPQLALQTFGPKYNWSTETVGFLDGAFFWTYVLFQIPAARLAETVGAKWVLAAAGIGSSLFSLVSPFAASLGAPALFATRLALGACQTSLYPAAYILYCKWLPPNERLLALPVLYAAAYLGLIISSLASGFLCGNEAFGWPFAFYLPAVVCGAWSLAWIVFGSSSPRSNKFISNAELVYIEANLESSAREATSKPSLKINSAEYASTSASQSFNIEQHQQQHPHQSMERQLSWKKLLSSEPVWALIFAFVASNWSLSMILIKLPAYLNYVVHISTLKNGAITASIYGLYCVCCAPVGSIATMMVETRAFGLTRLQVRKLFQSLALFGQTVCYIFLPHVLQVEWVLTLLMFQVFLFSLVNGGEVQIPSEMSPEFSGTIYALCNSAGSATGFILPIVQSALVKDNSSREQWALFFSFSALIIAVGASVFLIFGKNSYQNFSRDDSIDNVKLALNCDSWSLQKQQPFRNEHFSEQQPIILSNALIKPFLQPQVKLLKGSSQNMYDTI